MERKRPRIIVADDHAAMRALVARVLADDYSVVSSVADGQDLVDAARSVEADLMIVDIAMPILNGLEALRRIRRGGITTPAVVFTNSADPAVAREALRIGASGFVVKDHLVSELNTAIQAALRGEQFVSPWIEQVE